MFKVLHPDQSGLECLPGDRPHELQVTCRDVEHGHVRAGQGEVREEALQQWLRRDHVYLVVVAYRQEYLVALHSRLIGYLLPRLHEGLGHQNINW